MNTYSSSSSAANHFPVMPPLLPQQNSGLLKFLVPEDSFHDGFNLVLHLSQKIQHLLPLNRIYHLWCGTVSAHR